MTDNLEQTLPTKEAHDYTTIRIRSDDATVILSAIICAANTLPSEADQRAVAQVGRRFREALND